jgi:hypothetical protein
VSYVEETLPSGEAPKKPHLGVLTGPNEWLALPPGSNFCLFDNPDPTTPDGKIQLVFVRMESKGRKLVFMCGCSKCRSATPEDHKSGRVRYLTFTGKWSGVHAHK